MAPWVAAYDWTKGSLLVTGGTLVEVGPAQKWNGGKVLRGEIEELMGRARIALESLVRTATGVVCGLAAADEWLAARVNNPALIKRAVVGEVEEEYKELAELMSAIGCMHQQKICCVVTHLYCCVALFPHVPCTRRQDSIHSPSSPRVTFYVFLPNSIFSAKSNPMQLALSNRVTSASYTLHPMSTPTHFVFHKAYMVHRITHARLTPTLQGFT